MTILATADTVGGVWTYALELARALAPHGVATALATMGAPLTTEQRAEAQAVPDLALFESAFRLEWMPDPWEDVAASGEWLLDIARDLRPDLVHLNTFAHGTLPFEAPVLMVGHSCVASWWDAVKGEPAPPAWDTYRQAVGAGLSGANGVIAPTSAMLSALQRHHGRLHRAGVVYNGRDPDLFMPAPKEDFIFAAGRLWDEAKNIAALAQVAPELPWPVRVAGDARHPDGKESAPANVRMLGRLPAAELSDVMGRAAIYALPARYEPFGLSALEAALSGCALVLGDIASLREVWGDAALFVPPEDPAALRDALMRLINDAALRREMARRARIRARRYTPEQMAEGYLSVYQSLLEKESPACAL